MAAILKSNATPIIGQISGGFIAKHFIEYICPNCVPNFMLYHNKLTYLQCNANSCAFWCLVGHISFHIHIGICMVIVIPAFVSDLFPVTCLHHIYSTTLVIIIVIDNLKYVIIFV